LPVLYVAVNILQTWFYTRAQPEMFRTQLIIQLVFVYLVLSFPSGVTLYWVLSTIIQVGQQWLINRQVQARMAGTALGAMAAANKAAATTTPAKPKDTSKKAPSKK
jgi:YidC/Oxa1 family membrane protein insertase